ncbi:hypothetical protein ABZY45_07945 [Streptomyces sp. NPDC006516]|uniref:hypothetical protein n=1 Tax=Streptomyces sp. NPDC006516 TaxID=3154309 RepID=UPI0033AF4E48
MSDPVNSTILLIDIERYSDRDDVEQAYLRRMLFDLTDRTLLAAGIEETSRRRADRGDSVMELIDANASLTALLRTLLTFVPAQLRGMNRMAAASAQMRLRAVVASGYVTVEGGGGWVGSDLNHACRLLDATVLRQALRERKTDFALCVAEPVYRGVVRHDHTGVPADEFHAVTLDSKNGPLPAWIHGPVPRSTAQPGSTGAGAPAPVSTDHATRSVSEALTPAPRTTFDLGGATVNGGVVGGDNHGIGGGTFHGDIHLGG